MPAAPVFTGMTLDRASEARHDPAWVAAQRADPAARAVLAAADGVVVDGSGSRLLRVGLGAVPPEPESPQAEILLGLSAEGALFGVDLGDTAEAPAGGSLVPLREAGLTLERSEAGLAAYLMALVNWHRRHRFCAACGAPTVPAEGGQIRRCTRCGTHHFPRTDPAVIMLVHDGERVLLGRRAAWPEGRYSVLAGFVSPGESLEEAVLREVQEESGIRAREPRFVASQPWPFPSSLMLGFTARAEGGEPAALDGELADVRWFTRADVLAALDGSNPQMQLPPAISIAYLLIEAWARRPVPA